MNDLREENLGQALPPWTMQSLDLVLNLDNPLTMHSYTQGKEGSIPFFRNLAICIETSKLELFTNDPEFDKVQCEEFLGLLYKKLRATVAP